MDSGASSVAVVPIFQGTLTKKVLLTLPTGAFLMSNCFDFAGAPLVAEFVPDAQFREGYWRTLKSRSVTGRKAHVFACAEDYAAYMDYLYSLPGAPPRPTIPTPPRHGGKLH